MSKKVILITGATGLVGTALLGFLNQKPEYELRYLTRSKKPTTYLNATGFHWDPSKFELDRDAIKGVDVIINLAGASVAERWSARHKKAILDSRIDSLETLERALKKTKGVSKLISASAIGIYKSDLAAMYTEDSTEFDSGFLSDVVQKWESKITTCAALVEHTHILRFGIALSTKGGALEKLIQPAKLGFGAALGNGTQWQSWIHIDDLVRLIEWVIVSDAPALLNAVAPNPVTAAELSRKLSHTLHKPFWLKRIPEPLVRILLGEMSEVVLQSQRVLPKAAREVGFNFNFSTIETALDDLIRCGK